MELSFSIYSKLYFQSCFEDEHLKYQNLIDAFCHLFGFKLVNTRVSHHQPDDPIARAQQIEEKGVEYIIEKSQFELDQASAFIQACKLFCLQNNIDYVGSRIQCHELDDQVKTKL
jgi:hypothetical protein